MYSHDDPDILWVSPLFDGKSNGTYDAPYTDIGQAIEKARAGSTVVLRPGEYGMSVTIQNSGTITLPIRITADQGAESAVYCTSSWFLYDVTDMIVSGIAFKDIPAQAISVIGACERNSFHNLRFLNCGLDKNASCTFFFGGSGAQCNVVENCTFQIDAKEPSADQAPMPIGIMITEGDTEELARPNTNHVFRGNRFSRYGCAVVIGTRDTGTTPYNHIIEQNSIEYCSGDGMRIKCPDTIVRGNSIGQCRGNGISVSHGREVEISNNRIDVCAAGISIGDYDCTISNNCIIGCRDHAIVIETSAAADRTFTGNIIIEHNTCVESGIDRKDFRADILLDTDSNCIIRCNLFYGQGFPYMVKKTTRNAMAPVLFVDDNKTNGQYLPTKGCTNETIPFNNRKQGNFTNTTGYGAYGSMTQGASTDPCPETDTDPKSLLDDEPVAQSAPPEDPAPYPDEKELYIQSLFLSAEQTAEELEEDTAGSSEKDDDGIIDFSQWD